MSEFRDQNLGARHAWDTNAEFWDQRMGEGNEFFNILIWPAIEQLLLPVRGNRILDIACGNGLTSRRLAEAGASVVAIDFSERMIHQAKMRSRSAAIDYRIVDATDLDALLGLEKNPFDGALCNMALMDMADIRPLLAALGKLLRPGGRFVFSVVHPCFNNPASVLLGEVEDREGSLVTTFSVKISRYQKPYSQLGLAMHGQPVPHPYFHRPLRALLGACFEAGFVLDALEERAFPPDNSSGKFPLSWNSNFCEIPPVLLCRLLHSTQAIPKPST